MEAATAWAEARCGKHTPAMVIDDEMAAQLAAFGVVYEIEPTEVVADDAFEVWPENWRAVAAFISLETQWRMASLGLGGLIFTGLDYAAAAALLRGKSLSKFQVLMGQLQIMERAALPMLNEKD